MSIIWDLKKLDLSNYLYKRKIKQKFNKNINSLNIRNLHLTKSNSFNGYKQKSENNYRYKGLLTTDSFGKRKKKENLKDKNIKLKISLNNINKELILAKSAGHKKVFQMEKNCRLISTSLNIKKLNLFDEQNNILSSSYSYNKKKENEIVIKSFKSNLIQKIKNKYNNLENDYKKNTIILSNLKNNIRNSNNKELTSENEKIMDNFIKIKNKYDSSLIKNNEYKIKMKEYLELEEQLNKKNFCILELKESLNNLNNNNINLENDIENLKIKLRKLENENEKLNNQYYALDERCSKISNNKREIEKEYEIFINENN